jgi:hypothetical protein
MAHFEVDALFGTPCEGYQYQAVPAAAALDRLGRLQDEIEGASAGALIRIPRPSLHVTIVPLLDADEHFEATPAELWRHHSARWTDAIERASAAVQRFELEFVELRYTPKAVILLAMMPNRVTLLRKEVAEVCGLPDRATRVPNITHMTLFRYRDPSAVTDHDVSAQLPVRLAIDELRFVRETVYPTLAFEPIRSWRLAPETSG